MRMRRVVCMARQAISPRLAIGIFLNMADPGLLEAGSAVQSGAAGGEMIDHVSISVADLQKSAAFYAAVLEPLGYRKIADRPASVGFGKTYPEFWLNARPSGARAGEDTGAHICLRARS